LGLNLTFIRLLFGGIENPPSVLPFTQNHRPFHQIKIRSVASERSVAAQRRPLRRIFHSEAEKNVAGADPAVACLGVVFPASGNVAEG